MRVERRVLDFRHGGGRMMLVVKHLHRDAVPRVVEQTARVPDRRQIARLRVVVVVDRLADDVDLLRADRHWQINAPSTPETFWKKKRTRQRFNADERTNKHVPCDLPTEGAARLRGR